ncbi:MAG: hypothetical protein B9S33_12100 [Pedosphaera sp. Tous-C6FEB]|nr:MAG: hypothetical protein B9S33_12100 [Pedosphaera sp. Tous-C6FEB]
MKLMRLLRSSLAVCFLAGALHLHAATYQFPELVRVVGADNKHIVGAVKSETGESLGVLDLKTGQTLTYAKASIRTLGRRLSDRDAAQACGSARLLAWKIQQVLPQNQIVGKVASLDQGTIYTTLNAKMGISKDEALSVYRVSKEIRDPDTGQVLDRERRKIAKLVVTEVGERVVKAKTADDLEIEIRVGDEVEPVKQSRAVAILPATDLAGNVRASGKRFSEELVSSLTELGVAVVERSQLDRVRGELALQQTAAFDGDTARQLGKLVGAFAVLTGTISDDWVTMQNTLLRLVKVETGEVIFGAALTSGTGVPSAGIVGTPSISPMPDSPSASVRPQGSQNAAARAGQVVAWGMNKSGQCNVPAELRNVVGIAAGRNHSMALRSDGTVVAWGDTSKGQAVVPAGLKDIIGIAAGYSHSVALRKDGTVVCWGENESGQLNVPSTAQGKVAAISAGASFTVVLTKAGTVVAWGKNNVNQTRPPAGLATVIKVSCGAHHSIAMKRDGTLVAWGLNENGAYNFPSNILAPRAFAGGWGQTAIVQPDGSIAAWGYDGYGAIRKRPNGNVGAVAITAGESHIAALKSDGTVLVWGDNGQGELNVPGGLNGVVRISSGAFHVLALR